MRASFSTSYIFILAILSLSGSVSAQEQEGVAAEAQPIAARAATTIAPEPTLQEDANAPAVGGHDTPEPEPAPAHDSDGPTWERSRSRSMGTTNGGRLQNGVLLESSETVRARVGQYGTQEMVSLLQWASREVASQHEGAVLMVRDVSREGGGRYRPHRSHQVGRDADVGFYMRDATSTEPIVVDRFVRMNDAGKGENRRGQRFIFDVPRNWALIESLLRQDRVPVQYIMVIRPLMQSLRAYGESHGASPELLERFDAIVGPRTTGRGRFARRGTHDSHFHVRIFCATDDRPRCNDAQPFYPWLDRPSDGQLERQRDRERRERLRQVRARRDARRAAARARRDERQAAARARRNARREVARERARERAAAARAARIARRDRARARQRREAERRRVAARRARRRNRRPQR